MMSDESSSVSSPQTQLNEHLPTPPPGMRYVLVPEQQASSTSPQIIYEAQQQRIGLNQCYACNVVAVERCFFGTNSVNHCKRMMCLQHAQSTVQGPPWGNILLL